MGERKKEQDDILLGNTASGDASCPPSTPTVVVNRLSVGAVVAGTWLHDALAACRKEGVPLLFFNDRLYDVATGVEVQGGFKDPGDGF